MAGSYRRIVLPYGGYSEKEELAVIVFSDIIKF